MTEFMLTMELMLQTESRGLRLRDWTGAGSCSPSENQGVCGETGEPVLEQSMVSAGQESRLSRGEGQWTRSEAEVLHEGTMEVFENNECREDSPVVSVIVGEFFGTSDISGSSKTIPDKVMPLRWGPSETE